MRSSRRRGISRWSSQGQFSFLDRGGGVLEGGGDVVCLEVREVVKDLGRRTSSGELTNHRGHRYPQSTDARNATHLGWIDGDPLVVHSSRLCRFRIIPVAAWVVGRGSDVLVETAVE